MIYMNLMIQSMKQSRKKIGYKVITLILMGFLQNCSSHLLYSFYGKKYLVMELVRLIVKCRIQEIS
jgi:hypothetical protein